jgi:hypothetical protein
MVTNDLFAQWVCLEAWHHHEWSYLLCWHFMYCIVLTGIKENWKMTRRSVCVNEQESCCVLCVLCCLRFVHVSCRNA